MMETQWRVYCSHTPLIKTKASMKLHQRMTYEQWRKSGSWMKEMRELVTEMRELGEGNAGVGEGNERRNVGLVKDKRSR